MGIEAAIKVQGVTKTFNGIEVIKNCSITVESNSIYGFLGANGAGKTTVFKMLTGLLAPTSGKIEILGYNILTEKNEILRNIGSIIEVPIFYEHLSARENLEIHLSYMGVENPNIAGALDLVGLYNTSHQPVYKFSLGMRQRLGIAKALVHNPKILILDEPINGLDPMGIREMRNLFVNIVKEKGITILISSHIISEIEQIANKIGVIVDGTVVEEVPLASIKKEFPNGLEDYFFDIMRGVKNA